MPDSQIRSRLMANRDWLASIGFGLLALFLRLYHLGLTKGYIFDEVYYAKNAHSLLLHGVEMDSKNAAEFIVHPPVGKWIIGLGIKLFGYNEFGWRFSSALFGSISIVLIFWVTKKLFNNFFLSSCAALLMSLDGLHLVHSRTALLDLFLMFFILIGFFALITSHHWWAAICFGLAFATKWNGAYFVAAYFFFVVYSDYRTNKALEIEEAFKTTLTEKLRLRIIQYIITPMVVYLVSWSGWFLTKTGWDRNWADNQQHSFWNFIPSPLRSFWHYQAEILGFHQGLTTKHPYSANPWNWLVQGRPTSFFYDAPKNCSTPPCAREILALGTPLIWWAAIFAIAITFGYWLTRREWQSGLILLSIVAGYVPWFLFQKRTMFSFYSISFEPFIILILVYCIAKYLETATDPKDLKEKKIIVGIALAACFICFIYFLPVFMGTPITYHSWLNKMWLPSWI